MFIYHFSRLIKSKLIWGFLAFLMVFAFVVMDSCSGSSPDRNAAGFINEQSISYEDYEFSAKTLAILSQSYMPFGLILRGETAFSPNATPTREQVWKLLAIRELAKAHDLASTQAGAVATLKRMFADENGNFNASAYRQFLSANGYADSRIFEKTFAEIWLPAQTLTMSIAGSVGWVSPTEQELLLSADYDPTTVRTAILKNSRKLEDIEVTDEQLKAWYDEHTDRYGLPEQRTISYVEVPASVFEADLGEIAEADALQYYSDHPDEFIGSATNATELLPYEEVKDRVLVKCKQEKAMAKAVELTQESLIAEIDSAKSLAPAQTYGEVKTATLRADRPFGFQNARDLVYSVFNEMDLDIAFNTVPGTDRVYLIQLTGITEAHTEPFETVRERVRAEVRRDLLAKRQEADGQLMYDRLLEQLAQEPDFAKAVEACGIEGFTASDPLTFVFSDSSKVEIPNRSQVLQAARTLVPKMLAKPVLLPGSNDLLFVYLVDRTPGDPLVKAAHRTTVAEPAAQAYLTAADWATWVLRQTPPTTAEGIPLDLAENGND